MLQQPPARHETTQPLIDFRTMQRVMNSKAQSFYKVRSSVLAGLLGPTNKFTQPSDFGMSCLRTWPIRGSLAFFASPFKKPASPGAMTSKLCTLIPGIGHWPEWNCWDLRFDSLGHSHSQTHVSSFLLSAHRDVLPQSTVFCDSLVSCLQMCSPLYSLSMFWSLIFIQTLPVTCPSNIPVATVNNPSRRMLKEGHGRTPTGGNSLDCTCWSVWVSLCSIRHSKYCIYKSQNLRQLLQRFAIKMPKNPTRAYWSTKWQITSPTL